MMQPQMMIMKQQPSNKKAALANRNSTDLIKPHLK